jgi:hypothetical protein
MVGGGPGKCRLPQPKMIKGTYLVSEPCYDPGATPTLLDVQRLRGNATFWQTLQPALRPELGAIDAMLAQTNPGSLMVCPRGDPEEVCRKFFEFWDSLEFIRVLFARGDAWEANFSVALEGMLQPRERLSLPGVAAKVVWIGGDATLETCATIDWTNSTYALFTVLQYMAVLREAAGEPDDDTIISICELLCLVAFAAGNWGKWDGRLILYVTDNDNTRRWLQKRSAKNRLARHLLRLLRYLEVRGGFVVVSAYIRTYHNLLCDFGSREDEALVVKDFASRGLSRVDLKEAWEEVVSRGFERRVHALSLVDKDDFEVASQLAYRRAPPGPLELRSARPLSDWVVCEVDATFGGYLLAASRLGARCLRVPAQLWGDWTPDGQEPRSLAGLRQAKTPEDLGEQTLVTMSLKPVGTPGPAGPAFQCRESPERPTARRRRPLPGGCRRS